jgi:hypothetical protein
LTIPITALIDHFITKTRTFGVFSIIGGICVFLSVILFKVNKSH